MVDKVFLSKPVVILLSGKAGSGKTSTAKYLKNIANQLGFEADIFSFGKQVKEVCSWFGWNGLKDERGRKLLQSIGMAVRDYDLNFWVDYLFKEEIDNHVRNPFDFIIIDDNRFINEIEYPKNKGYQVFTVRIMSENFGLSGKLSEDRSENSLPEEPTFYFDVIYNMGSFEDLYNASERLIKKILESANKF